MQPQYSSNAQNPVAVPDTNQQYDSKGKLVPVEPGYDSSGHKLPPTITPGQYAADPGNPAVTGTTLSPADQAENAKLDGINETIKQAAILRLQTPGRSQTILTQQLNAPKTGTVLTQAATKQKAPGSII